MQNALDYLLSPPLLAFALGWIAGLLKSPIKLSDSVVDAISVYLLLSIGLKGGAYFSETSSASLLPSWGAAVVIGVLTPMAAYFIFRRFGRFDQETSAGVAAHYGSVSAVTFIVGTHFLQSKQILFEPHFPAIVAILEIVGILIALMLARTGSSMKSMRSALHETFISKGVFILMGSFLIGAISGKAQIDRVGPLFFEPFLGVLVLFLLQLGLKASEQTKFLVKHGLKLVSLAILATLVNACIGFAVIKGISMVFDVTPGGVFLMTLLAATASYIAAPAVVSQALPKANASVALAISLGITFPFNLVVGIPMYAIWSQIH